MTDVTFGSTYRIPISQAGINSAKKAKLRELIESYPNGLIGKSKVGHARISIADSEDATFIGKLRKIGYKVYQKFEGENIDKEDLDIFIKERLDSRNYSQKGKKPDRLSREVRDKRRFDRNYTAPEILGTDTENLIEASVAGETKKSGEIFESAFAPKKVKTSEEIRQSEGYLKLVAEEGEAFAEAVYFGIKK